MDPTGWWMNQSSKKGREDRRQVVLPALFCFPSIISQSIFPTAGPKRHAINSAGRAFIFSLAASLPACYSGPHPLNH
jgi:hypothetical protein